MCSPFRERSEEDVIRRYKPVWAVGDELVAVASSSAIKVSLTNRTHLFKTSVTGRITKDWRANAAADSMPRSNYYMHLMTDASCQEDCLAFFFAFLRSLPQACAAAGTKAVPRAWTFVCVFVILFIFLR